MAREGGCLRVPIIYEWLHEVCTLCARDSHQLEACINLPVFKRVEVFVKKFDASGITTSHYHDALHQNLPNTTES